MGFGSSWVALNTRISQDLSVLIHIVLNCMKSINIEPKHDFRDIKLGMFRSEGLNLWASR